MESSDEESVAAAAILLSLKGKLEARKKAMWTKPWIGNRLSMGAYHALLQELKESDNQGFANFVRMNIESFELLFELLHRVAPLIVRQDTSVIFVLIYFLVLVLVLKIFFSFSFVLVFIIFSFSL